LRTDPESVTYMVVIAVGDIALAVTFVLLVLTKTVTFGISIFNLIMGE